MSGERSKISRANSVAHINRQGLLLVFPIKNQTEPNSLWRCLFPRTKMRWEWSDTGDDKVAQMWYLMKDLSDCRQVVYSKWYQGRATFFSREVFAALLHDQKPREQVLSRGAREVLELLESDSPLSTREIKRAMDLEGRFHESQFNRIMKELFQSLLVIGFGEVDDGAFPSLAVGATRTLYEDLWEQSQGMSNAHAQKILDRHLPPGSKFRKFYQRLRDRRPVADR